MSTVCSLSRVALLFFPLLSTAITAQPAAPPPPGMPDYVDLLEKTYNDRRLADYGNLFTENVQVYLDGKLTTTSRAELLVSTKNEFDQNLHIQSYSWAQGGQILVMQRVTGCIPVHPNPTTVYHGCTRARAVRYDIGDNFKITAIHILDADQAWNMHL